MGHELRVYVFAEALPASIVDGFHTASGVNVTVSTYETNEELVAALRARPDAYDIVMPSDYAVAELIASGSLRPLDLGAIPNHHNIERSFLSPYFDPGGLVSGARGHGKDEKYSLPWLWGTTGIAYDSTVVKPAPTSWSDLWNVAYRGRLVLPDDARETLGIGLLASGKKKNDAGGLGETKTRVQELVDAAVALDANSPETYLINGQAVIGAVFSGNAVLAQRGNPNVEYVLPEDGAGVWFDNLAIPSRSRHPAEAEAFINYLLRPDSGVVVIQQLPFSNPNHAAIELLASADPELYAAYQADPATNPPPDQLSGALMVKNIGPDGQAAFERAWADILAARPQPPPVEIPPVLDGAAPANVPPAADPGTVPPETAPTTPEVQQ